MVWGGNRAGIGKAMTAGALFAAAVSCDGKPSKGCLPGGRSFLLLFFLDAWSLGYIFLFINNRGSVVFGFPGTGGFLRLLDILD